MAMAVVDLLEMVNIENGKGILGAEPGKVVLECAAIWQLGQFVEMGMAPGTFHDRPDKGGSGAGLVDEEGSAGAAFPGRMPCREVEGIEGKDACPAEQGSQRRAFVG